MEASFKYVIAHNVRSAYNVGSFFRTCDAAGVAALYLTGYTPAPIDRFGREDRAIAKTALGAEKSVAWERREDILALINELKGRGITVVALEQDARAIDYRHARLDLPAALIVGNEPDGLSCEVLDCADRIIELPMRGAKESLNVSVALGIALYHFLPPLLPLPPPPLSPVA